MGKREIRSNFELKMFKIGSILLKRQFMKTGFKDPIAPKQYKEGEKPWNWQAPHYDNRSSCFMQAGTDYGVGHNQPVGHEGNPKSDGGVPKGRVATVPIYPEKREIL